MKGQMKRINVLINVASSRQKKPQGEEGDNKKRKMLIYENDLVSIMSEALRENSVKYQGPYFWTKIHAMPIMSDGLTPPSGFSR